MICQRSFRFYSIAKFCHADKPFQSFCLILSARESKILITSHRAITHISDILHWCYLLPDRFLAPRLNIRHILSQERIIHFHGYRVREHSRLLSGQMTADPCGISPDSSHGAAVETAGSHLHLRNISVRDVFIRW